MQRSGEAALRRRQGERGPVRRRGSARAKATAGSTVSLDRKELFLQKISSSLTSVKFVVSVSPAILAKYLSKMCSAEITMSGTVRIFRAIFFFPEYLPQQTQS